jgi:hypothetical protein
VSQGWVATDWSFSRCLYCCSGGTSKLTPIIGQQQSRWPDRPVSCALVLSMHSWPSEAFNYAPCVHMNFLEGLVMSVMFFYTKERVSYHATSTAVVLHQNLNVLWVLCSNCLCLFYLLTLFQSLLLKGNESLVPFPISIEVSQILGEKK